MARFLYNSLITSLIGILTCHQVHGLNKALRKNLGIIYSSSFAFSIECFPWLCFKSNEEISEKLGWVNLSWWLSGPSGHRPITRTGDYDWLRQIRTNFPRMDQFPKLHCCCVCGVPKVNGRDSHVTGTKLLFPCSGWKSLYRVPALHILK